MSKIIDVSGDGGDLVILGRAIVLPSSSQDGSQSPTDGSVRFNPTTLRAEFCVAGVWTELGSSGGGGGSTGPISIATVVGLQTALDGKSPTVHNHNLSSVDGLVSALDGKANVAHTHAISALPALQPILDSLQTQVSAKAALLHTHVIGDVTGLQTILNAKAALAHTHAQSDITGLVAKLDELSTEKYSVSLPASPPTNFTFVWTVARRTTFFGDFAGARGSVLNNPAAPYVITITRAGQPFGTITIGTNGAFDFATDQHLIKDVEVGQALLFTCPAQDGSIINPSFTLVGKYSG